MRRIIALFAALMLAIPAAAAPYVSLSRQFARFVDQAVDLPPDETLRRFGLEVAVLFPQFYAPQDGEAVERYRARVLRAVAEFPTIRERYEAAERAFPKAYADGLQHFAQTFPDFRPPTQVVLLHSLGQLDGGTRQLGGKTYLLFGADGIARYHEPDSIGVLFDHELFHVHHARSFGDCDPVWCGLWQEGLATYASAVMNPGANDRMLMLETPQPIRPVVDAHWRDALCLLAAKRLSTSKTDYGLFFFANANGTIFPPRFGYYLGYRLAERAAKAHSLQELAAMKHDAAERLVEATLQAMVADAGGCRQAAATNGGL